MPVYRPGALGMNMVDTYINRKHGKEEVTYGHDAGLKKYSVLLMASLFIRNW